jgi:thiamine-monophosphate kinase
MTVRELGEYPLVERLCRRLEKTFGIDPRVIVGAGDDAAVVDVNGVAVVLTVDAQLENVHFRRHWMPPAALGWKALAVSLSDIAAMGARPLAALLAIALRGDEPVDFLDAFYDGATAICQATGTLLVGGDIARSPNGLLVTSMVVGIADDGAVWRRDGAQPGDALLLTGTVGDAAAGLWLLENRHGGIAQVADASAHCVRRFRFPEPRVRAREALKGFRVHAAIDLSDGLTIDAGRLAHASKVAAVLNLNQLPVSEALKAVAHATGQDPFPWAMGGGEDYELLLAVPAHDADAACAALRNHDIPARIVGTVANDPKGAVLAAFPDGTRRPITGGFQHFADGS